MDKDMIEMKPKFYGFSFTGLIVTKKTQHETITTIIYNNDTNDENQTFERFLEIHNSLMLFKILTETEKELVFKTYKQFLYLHYTKWLK